MGAEWPPEKTEVVNGSTIYYWTIRDSHKKAAAAQQGSAVSQR